MAKGLQSFVIMNENDAKNGTQHLMLGLDLVEVRKTKAGTLVTMGIGGDLVAALANDTKKAILLIVDKEEWTKVEQGNP